MTQVQPEIRGAPAKLWDLVLKGKGHEKVREVLIHGPGGTGKSRGILEWVWWLANQFQGVRILVARKTRVSLTEAGLVTLEEEVIPHGHPILNGPGRANRDRYSLKNGSEIVIGGMDHPTRLYSTNWDVIYIQEAQELLEDEWERLRRGLRNFQVPVQVLIGDCNPEGQQHWLYRRMADKKTEGWESRHWDNPKWYSRETEEWTAEGRSYLESLARLTGVRKDRLFRGEWVSATGAVWDNFDAAIHVIDPPDRKPEETRVQSMARAHGICKFFGALDWGFASAGVLQVWGVDNDGRIFLVSEWYRTETGMGAWMDLVEAAHKEFNLLCVVADPSRPDSIQIANDYLSKKGIRRLLWAAHNRRRATMGNDMGGLDLVRQKLDRDKSGKPFIFIFRDSLRGRDQRLAEQRKCTCLVEEIPGYVYLQMQDGKPSKEATDPTCDDHACFPAGTLVTMWDGSQRPIQMVGVGEMVLTPFGSRAVLDSGPTGLDEPLMLLELGDGRRVEATPDHRFWTTKGMKRLDSLLPGDMLCAWQGQSWSNGAGSPGGATHGRAGIPSAATTADRSASPGNCGTGGFTARSMPPSMVQSRRGCASTTATGTPGTMTPTTSPYSHRPSTAWNTQTPWPRRAPSLQRGTAARPASPGTSGMRPRSASASTDARIGVAGAAGPHFRASSGQDAPHTYSVLRPARRPTAAHLASMTKRVPVPIAEAISAATATANSTAALVRVRRISASARAPVFNLTVDQDHVFLANGILTSNCDALRYAACFMWMRDVGTPDEGVRYKQGTWGQVLGFDDFWNSLS